MPEDDVAAERAAVLDEIREELRSGKGEYHRPVMGIQSPERMNGPKIEVHAGYLPTTNRAAERVEKIMAALESLSWNSEAAKAMAKEYGISMAVLERDAQEATRSIMLLHRLTPEQREERRGLFLAELIAVRRKIVAKHAWNQYLQSMDLEARVLGLYAPKTSTSLNVNVDATSDRYKTMTPQEKIALHKAAIAEEERHLLSEGTVTVEAEEGGDDAGGD